MKTGSLYKLLLLKNRIENLLLFPFILTGRIVALFDRDRTEYETFFFFPFYHIGGAEKIHYQVAQATGGPGSVIYFTRKSHKNDYLEEFTRSGCVVKDISRWTDNKWIMPFNFIFRGLVSARINRQQRPPLVFNGQSNFGYKISPWIRQSIPQAELIHALNTFTWIRIPFVRFYKKCITVSAEIVEKHVAAYAAKGLPSSLTDKFRFIMSRVELPKDKQAKDYRPETFSVLYVGRGTEEKRPWIAAKLAANIAQRNLPIRFEFAGDVEGAIDASLRAFCTFHGDVNNRKKLFELYHRAQVLIIPSSSESGPLVFMEAMAESCAIISTAVGYIREHVHDGQEGFVIRDIFDEAAVVREMEEKILLLYNDRSLLEKIGEHNRDYAYRHFNIGLFNEEYRVLFNSIRSTN